MGLHLVSLQIMQYYERNANTEGNGVTFHILNRLVTDKDVAMEIQF